MENKLKHLELIQSVVTRMATNSFMIRGWSITLVSAVFGLAAAGANFKFITITYFAIPLFLLLDGYYLHQERCFRALYESVALKTESQIDFSMNSKVFNSGRNTWINSIFSLTIGIFYGGMVALLIATICFIRNG